MTDCRQLVRPHRVIGTTTVSAGMCRPFFVPKLLRPSQLAFHPLPLTFRMRTTNEEKKAELNSLTRSSKSLLFSTTFFMELYAVNKVSLISC